MAKIIGLTGIVFGIPDEATRALPIRDLPNGARVRLRFRNQDFGRAFVCTREGIRHFILQEKDGAFVLNPQFEQGVNVRK